MASKWAAASRRATADPPMQRTEPAGTLLVGREAAAPARPWVGTPLSSMWRRLPTTVALAGLLTVVVLYVALWIIALSCGHTRAISRHYDVPAEFRGNHGPWRHQRVLRGLSNYALLVTVAGVLPLAWLGALVERSRRANIVAVTATLLFVVNCAHFPLFD